MKKIISILFLFLLCATCYVIYDLTENKELEVLSIGDNISNIKYLNELGKYNNTFNNKDYRIIDLLNVIKYNEEVDNISIHRLLNKSDILIISVGMNDLYYKLNDNTKEIYTYLNNMVDNYEELLKEISNYDYKKVYILGYYNIANKHNDIFTYVNYKINKLCQKYHYNYLELNKILYNNNKLLEKSGDFYLNDQGNKQIYNLIVENLKKT